jgi:23S rRNA (pseudouridine1915-N3)-methyltransferase
LKPSKRKEIQEIISEETKILKSILEKEKWYKILLYINSKQLKTEDFAKLIEEKRMKFGDIVFIIGWAFWVDYEIIKNNIDLKLSFSPMTFPHAQAIMMLLEQIYRASCMKKWIKYHH